ncbi:ion channel [Mucilaginibacter paludis]|uniref:Ion transport 2 domain protein n=1 Tax=Mucilaginibacter paludis DSM 18603 TaxID=714943 RepID=H1Y5V7_9SPHI|nr:ion channel [Mucilaginibacter paludis]EHQ30379.1 Ion transport 2 domain protein [Mucilaginibacter paludis DSM 18603]
MIAQIQSYISRRKYEFLVVSFLILIFGDTFSGALCLAVLLPLQNMVIALIAFYPLKWLRLLLGTLITLVILVTLFNCCYFTQLGAGILCSIFFAYFAVIAVKVYQTILSNRFISSEMIAATFCGFVLLCLAGAIVFITIAVNYPGSFSNISIGVNRFKNLTYFSFTTLLTIGYGDIVPTTLVAKRAVMLMGLVGHFYTVVLTGIIIGKYIRGGFDLDEQPKVSL